MKKMIKKIVFILIAVTLVLSTGIIIKTGKLEKLEGYLYSFASEITNTATECNATSSNAQGCATSGNATSSNAQGCATNGNATSSNTQSIEKIKVTNVKQDTKNNKPTTKKPIEEVTEEPDLEYNNSQITTDIIKKISDNKKIKNITINLDNNVNLSEAIFNAIKGKEINLTVNVGENQIIFKGNNITNPKEIDAQITYNLVSKDAMLKEIIGDGVVINFANNGELPGEAIIRIKVTDEMKQAISMDTILIYHYDENTKELTQLASNGIYKDGFIEFSINHNSKYVFVNKLIEEKEYVVGTTENKNEVSFLESYKTYIVIIGASVLAIIIVSIIIIIDKKAIAKRKAKANNKEN